MFKAMLEEMDIQVKESTGQWPAVFSEHYPGTFWFSFTHLLERQVKLTMRDLGFIKGRVMQSVIVGAIAGSLFNGLPTEDSNSMSGILYFCAVFGALTGMAMLPLIFAQRAVFYKHSRALFYPTPAFVLSQMMVLVPLQIIETIVFSTIVYWSVGLSADNGGGRFFTFMLIVFVFSLCITQFYRLVATCVASPAIAQTLSGVALILMVLFSGYIIPKSNIPPGWEWFYWINPINYVLRSVTVNEFLASDYDFQVCVDDACTATERFGDQVLKSRGNPTEQVWVWYGVAVLVALYLFFLVLGGLALVYIRTEPVPPAPIVVDYSETDASDDKETAMIDIPFDPVSFAFKDIWYTVKIGKEGEELDLLKGVSGYFEPGTLTALVRLQLLPTL
jgi:ABC-type multidrug transport system permease subunit